MSFHARRAARRSLALVVSTLLIVTLAEGVPAWASPAQSRASTASAVSDAAQAATESEARTIAEAFGHDVVVEALSSPNLLVSARPDGYLEAVSSQEPEQAKVGGRWKAVDTSLVERDDWYEPAVCAVPVRIGKGGDSVATR